jgi:hypothetical protein
MHRLCVHFKAKCKCSICWDFCAQCPTSTRCQDNCHQQLIQGKYFSNDLGDSDIKTIADEFPLSLDQYIFASSGMGHNNNSAEQNFNDSSKTIHSNRHSASTPITISTRQSQDIFDLTHNSAAAPEPLINLVSTLQILHHTLNRMEKYISLTNTSSRQIRSSIFTKIIQELQINSTKTPLSRENSRKRDRGHGHPGPSDIPDCSSGNKKSREQLLTKKPHPPLDTLKFLHISTHNRLHPTLQQPVTPSWSTMSTSVQFHRQQTPDLPPSPSSITEITPTG